MMAGPNGDVRSLNLKKTACISNRIKFGRGASERNAFKLDKLLRIKKKIVPEAYLYQSFKIPPALRNSLKS